MKHLLFVLAVALVFTACNSGEIARLQEQNDSLQRVNALKDSSMLLIANTMSDIQDNLDAIKEREGIIAVAVNNGDASKSQIETDLQAINQRLIDNNEKVANLQNKLKAAGAKNRELESIISVLQTQIDQQNAEIENLKALLADKDIEIGFLNNAVIRLSGTVDALAASNEELSEELGAAQDELSTGYYILAEKSTLKELGIITSDGLFSKKALTGDIDNSQFTQVNINEVTSIPLNTKKAKVYTSHPTSSYTLDEDSEGLLTLNISDKESFWQASKYLVVQVK